MIEIFMSLRPVLLVIGLMVNFYSLVILDLNTAPVQWLLAVMVVQIFVGSRVQP